MPFFQCPWDQKNGKGFGFSNGKQRLLTGHGEGRLAQNAQFCGKADCGLEFYILLSLKLGFPSGLAVKNPPAMQKSQEIWVQFLGQEDPLEEGMATHSNILA